jgi:hypothetical protein
MAKHENEQTGAPNEAELERARIIALALQIDAIGERVANIPIGKPEGDARFLTPRAKIYELHHGIDLTIFDAFTGFGTGMLKVDYHKELGAQLKLQQPIAEDLQTATRLTIHLHTDPATSERTQQAWLANPYLISGLNTQYTLDRFGGVSKIVVVPSIAGVGDPETKHNMPYINRRFIERKRLEPTDYSLLEQAIMICNSELDLTRTR